MKVDCIIIDDEPLALDLLENYIENIPFLNLVGRYTNALEALHIIQTSKIDIVFTDIQMNSLSGIQLIKSLTIKPLFILITAYKNYALEGYDIDVTDYLLKPVSFNRFLKASNKAYDFLQLKKGKLETDTIDYMFVPIDYSMQKVEFSTIKYIEANKDYIKIYFMHQKNTLLIRMSMKNIEDNLPKNRFMRIHKSYIVNIKQITTIRKNCIFLGDLELPVSEQYKGFIIQLAGKSI